MSAMQDYVMIDKLCINHPVETTTQIYYFDDNTDLFPFFIQIGNERMERKKGFIYFIRGDYCTVQNYG